MRRVWCGLRCWPGAGALRRRPPGSCRAPACGCGGLPDARMMPPGAPCRSAQTKRMPRLAPARPPRWCAPTMPAARSSRSCIPVAFAGSMMPGSRFPSSAPPLVLHAWRLALPRLCPPLPASFAPPCLLHLLLLKARRKLLFHGAKAPCLLTSARAAPVGLWGAGLGGLWGACLRGGQVPPALLTVRHAKNCNFGLNKELLRLDGAAPPLPADVGLDLQGAAGGLPPPPLCGASCLLFGRPSVRAMA